MRYYYSVDVPMTIEGEGKERKEVQKCMLLLAQLPLGNWERTQAEAEQKQG